MDKAVEGFKTITENLAAITIAVVLLAYYDLYTYYNFFGIIIYNFLEVSEIIFSISSLYVSLLFLIVPLSIGLILPSVNDRKFDKIMGMEKLPDPVTQEERLQQLGIYHGRMKKLMLLATSSGVFITCLLVGIMMFFQVYEIWLYMAVALTWGFLLNIYSISIRHRTPEALAIFAVNRLAPIIIVLSFFYVKNLTRYNMVINGKPKYGAEIKFSGNLSFIKVSGKDFYYLGSTKSHHFFYDAFSKKSMIYANTNVEWMAVRELRSGL